VSTKTLISVAEFDRLEERDDLRYELDGGELIEITKPHVGHNRVVMKLTRAFLQYLETNPAGELFTTDNLYVLGPTTRRIPDLSFLIADRASKVDPAKHLEGAPDLAIEVLSPSDQAAAMRRKMKQYFAAGARVVWVVYPELREVEVWESASGPVRVVGEGDALESRYLLPGFSCPVSDLF
jgi:Uma2 family endonuclease